MPVLVLVLSTSLAAPLRLVELFSSEGCSSCPPADTLLQRVTAADDSVVGLEFHVDYWNSLGWADPFSDGAYSARQSSYAALLRREDVFTPQAIVDGRESVVGSNAAQLSVLLTKAEQRPKSPLRLSFERSTGVVTLSAAAAPAGALWLAVTEDGLQTQVRRGENAGQRLRHGPVVRRFESLGESAAGAWSKQVSLPLETGWNAGRLRFVAAVQDPRSGQLLALGALRP